MRGAADSGSPNINVKRSTEVRRTDEQHYVDLAWGVPNKRPQSGARSASVPLRLLIRLSLRAAHDFQSLSVIFKHLRETGRILAQRLNRVKKKPLEGPIRGHRSPFNDPSRSPVPEPLPLNDEAPTARRSSDLSE